MSNFFGNCAPPDCPGCHQNCVSARSVLAERSISWGFTAFNLDLNDDGTPASAVQRAANANRRWSVMSQNETWKCASNPSPGPVQNALLLFRQFGAPFVGGQPSTITRVPPPADFCLGGAGTSNVFHMFPSSLIQFGGAQRTVVGLTTVTVDETSEQTHHFDGELGNEFDPHQYLQPCIDQAQNFDLTQLKFGQLGLITFNDCGNGPTNNGWDGVDLTGMVFNCDGAVRPFIITGASGPPGPFSYVRYQLPSIAAFRSQALLSGSYILVTWIITPGGNVRPTLLLEATASPNVPVNIPLPSLDNLPTDIFAVGRITILYKNCTWAAFQTLFPQP